MHSRGRLSDFDETAVDVHVQSSVGGSNISEGTDRGLGDTGGLISHMQPEVHSRGRLSDFDETAVDVHVQLSVGGSNISEGTDRGLGDTGGLISHMQPEVHSRGRLSDFDETAVDVQPLLYREGPKILVSPATLASSSLSYICKDPNTRSHRRDWPQAASVI